MSDYNDVFRAAAKAVMPEIQGQVFLSETFLLGPILDVLSSVDVSPFSKDAVRGLETLDQITNRLEQNNPVLTGQFKVAGADGLTTSEMQSALEEMSDGTMNGTTEQLASARVALESLGLEPTAEALDGMTTLIEQATAVKQEIEAPKPPPLVQA
ncbi:MAG: hypothetical protein ACPGRX_00875 [Bdellovibrionales bacterium]